VPLVVAFPEQPQNFQALTPDLPPFLIEVNHAGFVLYRSPGCILHFALGIHESVGTHVGGFDGIRHRRNYLGVPVCLFDVRPNSAGALLRC
jgi:hypothetical protein